MIHTLLSRLFNEVLVVTNAPEQYAFLPCRKVPDLLAGAGPLSGIHSALVHSAAPRVFVVGCDMPYLSEAVVRRVAASDSPLDGTVVPEGPAGLEPLHALYGKGCIPAVAAAIGRGDRRIVSFFGEVGVPE